MTEQTPMLLEKAKDLVSDLRMEYESNHPMFQEGDINILEWLINQAETARRLREENRKLREGIGPRDYEQLHELIEIQKKQLRKAQQEIKEAEQREQKLIEALRNISEYSPYSNNAERLYKQIIKEAGEALKVIEHE